MATRWATLRSIWWALCQCRAMLFVPLILNVLFLTGQGAELIGSLYDETRSASAWFTFAALMLLCFQVWYWSRLRLELSTIDAFGGRMPAHRALRSRKQQTRRVATIFVPVFLAFLVAGSQLYHFWSTERFGLVFLISIASLFVMVAIMSGSAHFIVGHRLDEADASVAAKSKTRIGRTMRSLLHLPASATDLPLPYWRTCMALSIIASIGGLVLALSLGADFTLTIGTIGIVILAMAIYVPLFAIPRLLFRNTSFPVTALFLLIPLLLPFLINAAALNTYGMWPQIAIALAGVLGMGMLWRTSPPAAVALGITAFLAFAALQNYSRVAYTITSMVADDPPQIQSSLEQEVDRWIEKTQYAERPTSYIYFVNAAGGGIRAAYWTTAVLGRIADCSQEFPDRLFAISGVSGGSLGAVIHAAQLRNSLDSEARVREPPDTPPLCTRHPLSMADVPLPIGFYQSQAKQILAYDFLTPVLGTYLFRDIASAFLPLSSGPDRAVVFEHEMSIAWQAHCARTRDRLACVPSNLDSTSFFALRRSTQREFQRPAPNNLAWIPILLLNGTHQETGKRVITSHVKIRQDVFTDAYDFISNLTHKDIPIAASVLNSARFPIVSPSGVVIDAADGGDTTLGHIIDGGYFENNGAATLEELVTETMRIIDARWPKDLKRPKPVVIEILNNPDYAEQDYAVWNEIQDDFGIQVANTTPPGNKGAPTLLSQVVGALQGLYNTSGGREVMASKSLIKTMRNPRGLFIQFRLCPNMAPSPPLGWLLTPQSQQAMDDLLLGVGDRRPNASSGRSTATYLNCFNANQRSLARLLSLLSES